MPAVRREKLATVDAFVVFDLDHAETSCGLVRQAPKILVDGAALLARSQTYQFASFEMQVGGASAGINTTSSERQVAVDRFVEEIRPMVADGRFLPDPGKGVTAGDLSPLRAVDPRDARYFELHDPLVALGLAEAGTAALGGLDGRTAAVECFDSGGPLLVRELAERGARVVAVGTSSGAACSPEGFDPAQVAGCWDQHGPDLVAQLGPPVTPASELLACEADVLYVGSRAGVLDHVGAQQVQAGAVVPTGPVPVTAKALAVLRRRGVTVLPDFLTTAGAVFAAHPPPGHDLAEIRADAARRVAGALGEVLGHEDGPLLAACYRAEAFLRSWCPVLPFGRPLA